MPTLTADYTHWECSVRLLTPAAAAAAGPTPADYRRTAAAHLMRRMSIAQRGRAAALRRARAAEHALVRLVSRKLQHAPASAPHDAAAPSIPTDPHAMLTPRQAAALLGCNERTVRNRCRDGAIPYVRLKDAPVGAIRIRRADLDTFTRPAVLPRSMMRKIVRDARAS